MCLFTLLAARSEHIFFLQDALDDIDYTAHLIVHLIDNNDIVNAKFLYQRTPEPVRKRSQSFIKIFNVVKALNQNLFGTALSLLREPFPASSSANPIKDSIESLRQILVWHLSEHTVPELIADAYSNIEMSRIREMLGQPAELNSILTRTNLLASSNADAQGFVEVKARQAQCETFALD